MILVFGLSIAFITVFLRILHGRPCLQSSRRFSTWSVWLAVIWWLLLPYLHPLVAGTIGVIVLSANLMSTVGRWVGLRTKKTSIWDIWTHGGLLLALLIFMAVVRYPVNVMWAVWGGIFLGVLWWIFACIPSTWPYPQHDVYQTRKWCAPVTMVVWFFVLFVVAIILRGFESKVWPLTIEAN